MKSTHIVTIAHTCRRRMTETHDFVIIRGAPGSGKSTLARELMASFGYGVTIEVDRVRGMINQVNWDSHQQHFDGIKASAELCKLYFDYGYHPVVLVDTFGYGSLEIATNELPQISFLVVSLTCSKNAIAWRLFWRFGGYRDSARARKFDSHIRATSHNDDLTFDTSEHGAAEIARSVVARILVL